MKEETLNNLKKEIVEILKNGEKSTTEISASLDRNYYFSQRVLDEMESIGLIEKITLGKFTFWRLKCLKKNSQKK